MRRQSWIEWTVINGFPRTKSEILYFSVLTISARVIYKTYRNREYRKVQNLTYRIITGFSVECPSDVMSSLVVHKYLDSVNLNTTRLDPNHGSLSFMKLFTNKIHLSSFFKTLNHAHALTQCLIAVGRLRKSDSVACKL
jgi:hypothetical protein